MNFFLISQIVIAILLIGAILLQAEGVGLGSIGGDAASAYHTKRGVEKTVFIATVVLAILFTFLSILALV